LASSAFAVAADTQHKLLIAIFELRRPLLKSTETLRVHVMFAGEVTCHVMR
jgi:hypothetical protein